MSNLSKKWIVLAATVSGTMFACLSLPGCGGLGGQWQWIWAILNEDIFG